MAGMPKEMSAHDETSVPTKTVDTTHIESDLHTLIGNMINLQSEMLSVLHANSLATGNSHSMLANVVDLFNTIQARAQQLETAKP